MNSLTEPIFFDYKNKMQVDILNFIKTRGIKIVYWDLGGTLVELSERVKQQEICEINAECKCHLSIAMYNHLIRNEWIQRETPKEQQRIKSVKTDQDELRYWIDFFEKAFRKYHIRKTPHLLVRLAKNQANANSFELYPYTEETLTKLTDMGIRIGIISNAFRSARKILKRKNLLAKIDSEYILLSCEYNSIKPEENIYKKAIEKARVRAKEILFIDDRESFLGQAVKLEMNALLIKHDKPTYTLVREVNKRSIILADILNSISTKTIEHARTIFPHLYNIYSIFGREINS